MSPTASDACSPFMQSPSPATESSQAGRAPIRRARPLLGTLVEIGICSQREASLIHRAIDQAFQDMERIHALMSYQDPHSELSRLNREAARAPQVIDPHTAAVLSAALRLARLSGGAFDPTVATLPDRGGARWQDVEFEQGCVHYRRPLQLDFGGIAKGYAVDLAVQRLRDHGFTDFIVNAGGDLRVGGERTVWLRDPVRLGADPRRLMLRDRALATSAAYFSPVSGDGTTHLVDPASGAPYRGPTSVSVLADECMRADALTKVALFAPCAVAERVLALENAQAIVLDPCAAA